MFNIKWDKFRGVNHCCKLKNNSNNRSNDENYKDRNFELLAVEIVNDITNKTWAHTSWTRDSGHDGFLILSMYNNGNNTSEWWMEAKYIYDNDNKTLSRYRLDATIVSRIISNHIYSQNKILQRIDRVFIITNAKISTKTINDLKIALENSGGSCITVIMQKEDIEFWLFEHKERVPIYFNMTLKETESIILEENKLYIHNKFEIYPMEHRFLNFKLPAEYIYKNKKYLLYLTIFSSNEINLEIIGTNGIKVFDYEKKICKGKNNIILTFLVDQNYNESILKFYINGIEKNISCQLVDEDHKFHLTIQSHNIIQEEIENYIKDNSNIFSTYLVLGESGSGKTTILNSIINKINNTYYYIAFTEDSRTNLINLIKFVYHIFFIFQNPEDIDEKFINEINKLSNNQFEFLITLNNIIQQCSNKETNKSIIEQLEKLSIELPKNSSNIKRILFIDDIHKASVIEQKFLEKLFHECTNTSIIVKIVAFGINYFEDNNLFTSFLKYNYRKKGEILKCKVTSGDFIKSFNGFFNVNIDINIDKSLLLNNILEIKEFCKYVDDNKLIIDNNNSFILEYSRFKNSDNAIECIRRQFKKNIDSFDELTNQYLKRIYLSVDQINYYDIKDDLKVKICIRKLIASKLIKKNILNILVPYHDTYRNVFFKYFININEPNPFSTLSYPDRLITEFNFSKNTSIRKKAAEKLFSIRHTDSSTTLYALEPIFVNLNNYKDSLITELGKFLFYKLYQAYGVACANHSANTSGKEIFEQIYNELKSEENYELAKISLVCLSEVLNSNFDGLLINEAEKCYLDFTEKYKKLNKIIGDLYDIEWLKRKLIAEEIKVLIDTTLDKPISKKEFNHLRKKYISKKINSVHHYIGFTARYAQLLYTSNIKKAYAYTFQAYKIMNKKTTKTDQKHIGEISFQLKYVQMLKENNPKYLPALKEMCENFRLFNFNKFRKTRCALIAACFKFGDINTAKAYILEESVTTRTRRNKLEIFNYQNLALQALLVDNDKKVAINLLKNELELVGEIESYTKIIKHNIAILEKNVKYTIEFALNNSLKSNVLYIDPRGDR